MRSRDREVFRDEDGAAAVEYGLLLAFVFLVVFASVQALGLSVRDIFTTLDALLS